MTPPNPTLAASAQPRLFEPSTLDPRPSTPSASRTIQRLRICAHCPNPCDAYKAAQIDPANPAHACPRAHWSAYTPRPQPSPTPATVSAPRLPRQITIRRARQVAPSNADMAIRGPLLWAELHRRPWLPEFSATSEAKWLEEFTARLCCQCRTNWQTIQTDLPPDLTTPERYFAWTVEAHNRVNAHIGKPQVTLAAASELWPI